MSAHLRKAVYAGTFDPVTRGHLDIIERARKLFDFVVIGVARSIRKKPLFSAEKRKMLLEDNIKHCSNVSIQIFDGLTVDFAQSIGAQCLIRGIRALSDFEHEFQMAQMNRHLAEDIETLFFMPSQEYFYTSSTLIKQVAYFDSQNLERFVPENVLEALRQESLKSIWMSLL